MRTAIVSLMSFGLAWMVPQLPSLRSESNAIVATDAESVQDFLGLTDDQQQKLEDLSKRLREKAGASMQDLESKQKALRLRLASNDNDALATGKALLALEVAKRNTEKTSGELRAEAMQLLTDDQREKLNALEQAAKLHPLARQAMSMFLIPPPDSVLNGSGPLGMFPAKRRPAPPASAPAT
jgi:Spy/CpxP family protein refolding chaperone